MSHTPARPANTLSAKLAKLGRLIGAELETRYAHKDSYTAVDLNQKNFVTDAFHAQGKQVWQQLFGNKGSSIQKLLTGVVPAETLKGIGDGIYDTLAKWAKEWAAHSLAKDARFASLATLSLAEKDAFANDVNRQHRALAAAGAVTALFGLKGVVADTAWLLLVSLRNVYQLAMIYGQPLDGKAGITMAYGVLSGAELDKMQEKQVIVTALALAHLTLKNAQSSGVDIELQRLGARYQLGHLTQLNKYVNLDKLNGRWLRALLPMVAAATVVHYNERLIEAVIGTAQVTFRQNHLLTDKHGEPKSEPK